MIIDGAFIGTDLFDNSLWPGIEVWGNANAHQYPIHDSYLQGYLELKNGATIENALCAVELWHPGDYSTTGGIIRADSAFFHNNAKAVHALNFTNINPYNGHVGSYNASFKECDFSIDSGFLGTETFDKHIDITGVLGVEFHGCSFSVVPSAMGVSSTCSAINAIDAGFAVYSQCKQCTSGQIPSPCPDECLVPSSFSGFYDAIHAVHNAGAVRSFVIRESVFNNNEKGVYSLNTGYPTIRNNSFSVGRDGSCAFGIYVEDVAGFSIEENDFSPRTGFQGDTYGIGVFNCPAPNEVYLNSFNGLTCANLAVGSNIAPSQDLPETIQGLTYHCNQNALNTVDFCVLNDNGVGNINLQQGSPSQPAGNIFGGSSYHFYNDGEDQLYYYYNPSATGQTPNTSMLYQVNRYSTTATNICESHLGNGSVIKSPSEKKELEKEYQTVQEHFNQLINNYKKLLDSGGNQAELIELKALIAQAAYDSHLAAGSIIRSDLNDTVANPQELRTWLRNVGDIASDRLAIASFAQEGDFNSALELANQLPGLYNLKGDDLSDHAYYMNLLDLFKTLHETGRTTAQLTDEEIKMVEDITSVATGVSKSLAKALLESRPGERGSRDHCPDLSQMFDKGRGIPDNETQKTSDFLITVSPNPALSQVLIEYTLPETSPYGILKLVNSLGEKEMELQLESNKGSKVINTHGLPSGLYFIIITDLNGRSRNYKLIKE